MHITGGIIGGKIECFFYFYAGKPEFSGICNQTGKFRFAEKLLFP